jgi:hypothetical protein
MMVGGREIGARSKKGGDCDDDGESKEQGNAESLRAREGWHRSWKFYHSDPRKQQERSVRERQCRRNETDNNRTGDDSTVARERDGHRIRLFFGEDLWCPFAK